MEGGGWDNSLQNRTLTVTTILNPPYMMIKESTNVMQGNDQFEGFVPDMVEILSKILHFNYTLKTGKISFFSVLSFLLHNYFFQLMMANMEHLMVPDGME